MQPLQDDWRDPAAKDNGITHAATARSNLDAAITMRSAETELQNTIELRATASEIVAPKPGISTPERKKYDFETLFKMIFRRKITSAKMEKNIGFRASTFGDALCLETQRVSCICSLSKTHFVRDFLQNSIGNSSTSTTCNPIYIAGTILQLQITMKFCRPHMDETQLKPHLKCGTDPRMIWPHTRPSRTRRTAKVDHRRSGTHFVWKNIGFRASAISQKRISCETSFKTPSATHPPAPLAIPFALREQSPFPH